MDRGREERKYPGAVITEEMHLLGARAFQIG